MKKILTILLTLVSLNSFGQLDITKRKITIDSAAARTNYIHITDTVIWPDGTKQAQYSPAGLEIDPVWISDSADYASKSYVLNLVDTVSFDTVKVNVIRMISGADTILIYQDAVGQLQVNSDDRLILQSNDSDVNITAGDDIALTSTDLFNIIVGNDMDISITDFLNLAAGGDITIETTGNNKSLILRADGTGSSISLQTDNTVSLSGSNTNISLGVNNILIEANDTVKITSGVNDYIFDDDTARFNEEHLNVKSISAGGGDVLPTTDSTLFQFAVNNTDSIFNSKARFDSLTVDSNFVNYNWAYGFGGFEDSNIVITISVQNDWYHVTNATNNAYIGDTASQFATIVNDTVKLLRNGKWKGTIKVTFSGLATNNFECRIYNTTQGYPLQFKQGNEGEGAGNNSIISLTVTDIITNQDEYVLQIRNTSAANDVTIFSMVFDVEYIGEIRGL